MCGVAATVSPVTNIVPVLPGGLRIASAARPSSSAVADTDSYFPGGGRVDPRVPTARAFRWPAADTLRLLAYHAALAQGADEASQRVWRSLLLLNRQAKKLK